MSAFRHDTWLSPFTWRYGSEEMRALWGEVAKRRTWRRIWIALARAQQAAGLVTEAQVADLTAHADEIDIDRAHAIEADIQHDLMAEVHTYAEQCGVGGGIIHLGATSMDVEDNADALRVRDSLRLLLQKVEGLMLAFADAIDMYADVPTMAFTHLQPAEPTTMGYRMAQYGLDLLMDHDNLTRLAARMRGKGFKGACGTSASYAQLLEGSGMQPADLEARIMDEIGLPAFPVATQTYARKQDFDVASGLASLAQTLSRFAFDLRVLQSPPLGEWAEPFGKKQVGSSAMPFKRNPINAENMGSLGRLVAALPRVAWDNAAQGVLERTLDDSANRRTTLPEAFLAVDEMLKRALRILTGLRVDTRAADRLMAVYGTFAATERVLMVGVKRGGDRQELHEVIREHSLLAWEAVREQRDNPLMDALSTDPRVTRLIPTDEIRALLDATAYVGDAPERARALARQLRDQQGSGATESPC